MKNKKICVELTAYETEYLLEAINRRKYYTALNRFVIEELGNFLYNKILAQFELDAKNLGLSAMEYLNKWKKETKKPRNLTDEI